MNPDAPGRPRRYPVGAEYADAGVDFRVWAPTAPLVSVELGTGDSIRSIGLRAEPSGYFSGRVEQVAPGTPYRFRLPSGSYPDPASRFQPDGPHGASAVVDPAHAWTDATWRGRPVSELVLYEMHIGTFTNEGTWRAASEQLAELARMGITCIEVMPIADFAGSFGWGYDGVDLFAPTRLYGTPADAKAFVDRAHSLGMMVVLDVVYNHLGPDGCYLREFSADYFSTRHKGEWGDPLNFDGETSAPVREFFLSNARYWIEEYHFDGLRLDATQQIFDSSPVHVLAEVSAAVRAGACGRKTFLVAENEPQEARLLRPRERGGFDIDAVWNDDFHHSAMVAGVGRAEAYYLDYRGAPQEFISACKHGFLFQGQLSRWQAKRRGTPSLDLRPDRFVAFTQNHDQVANSLRGARLHELTSPGMLRTLTALHLLSPSIPLLFQGQEFAASSPFLFFADHNPELAPRVAEGRRKFLRQFRSLTADDAENTLAGRGMRDDFQRSKLDFRDRERNRPIYHLHEDLLTMRRTREIFRQPAAIDGAVLSDRAFVLRLFDREGDDHLLIVNLGGEVHLDPAPEPLLAPVEQHGWTMLWSTENPAYDGGGSPPVETSRGWIIPGPALFVLARHAQRELPTAKLCETD